LKSLRLQRLTTPLKRVAVLSAATFGIAVGGSVQADGAFLPFLSDPSWAISTVEDPTGLAPTPRVQKFELRTGDCSARPPYDDCRDGAERAALSEPIPTQSRSGVGQWLRFQVYLPEDFESTYPAKNRLAEFVDHRAQDVPWALEIGSTGVLWLGRRIDGDEEYFSLVEAGALRGEWLDVIVNVQWSTKAGAFNLWINGEQRAAFTGPTCDKCSVFFTYGISRVGVAQFRKRFPAKPLPTQTVYFTPVEVAVSDPGWIVPAAPTEAAHEERADVLEDTAAKPAVSEPESEAPKEEGTETQSAQDKALATEEGPGSGSASTEPSTAGSESTAIIILEGEGAGSSPENGATVATPLDGADGQGADSEVSVESGSQAPAPVEKKPALTDQDLQAKDK